MSDEIKIVPELGEAMADTFKNASEKIDTTMDEIKAIVSMLQGGALLGKAGESYCEVLTTKLDPSLLRLRAKLTELQADVRTAMNLMQETDKQVATKY